MGALAPLLERIGSGPLQTDILARSVIPLSSAGLAGQSLPVSHVGTGEDAMRGGVARRLAPPLRTPCIIPSVGVAPCSLRDATCVLYLRWTGAVNRWHTDPFRHRRHEDLCRAGARAGDSDRGKWQPRRPLPLWFAASSAAGKCASIGLLHWPPLAPALGGARYLTEHQHAGGPHRMCSL